MINAHTHGHGNLAKGMGDRWTLELLLAAGPWITGGRTLEEKYLATYVGAIEMLLKGCTACYDLTVEFPLAECGRLEACGRAYADAGMRAVLAPMVAEFSFYEAIPAARCDAAGTAEKVERLRLAPGEATLTAMRQSMQAWAFDREQVRPRSRRPSAPLLGRLHAPMRRAGARVRRRAAHPRAGIQGAGDGRTEALRQDADRASAGPRTARAGLYGRTRRLARS